MATTPPTPTTFSSNKSEEKKLIVHLLRRKRARGSPGWQKALAQYSKMNRLQRPSTLGRLQMTFSSIHSLMGPFFFFYNLMTRQDQAEKNGIKSDQWLINHFQVVEISFTTNEFSSSHNNFTREVKTASIHPPPRPVVLCLPFFPIFTPPPT